MSVNVIGESIITTAGLNALATASATGKSIKPRYFKISSQDILLHQNLNDETDNILPWFIGDINQYEVIDNVAKLICDIIPTDAIDYGKLITIYLDDGTLFMAAKPPYPFPPAMRQTYRLTIPYTYSDELMSFEYVGGEAVGITVRDGVIKDSAGALFGERVLPTTNKIINNGEFLFELLRSSGNVVQGFTYDKYTGTAYCSQVVSDKVRISTYYEISVNRPIASPDSEVDLDIDSHQALASFYYNGELYFVMNYGSDGEIIIFQFNGSGLTFSKIVKVFGESSGYCTAGISADGLYMVVEGYNNDTQDIKIFDIVDVMLNDNIEDKYIKTFSIDILSSSYPLQDITMDKSSVYIAYGDGNKVNDNFITCYSLDGKFKYKQVITVGMDDTDKYEQEALFWVYDNNVPTLSIIVATNEDGDNVIKAYSLLGESLYKVKNKTFDSDQIDNEYLLSGSNVFGIDTLNLDRVYANITMDSNIVTLNMKLFISGFEKDTPSDTSSTIYFDVCRLGEAMGFFRNIEAGATGHAESIGYSDITPCDTSMNGFIVNILNKNLGNKLEFVNKDFYTKACDKTNSLVIYTLLNFRVSI